MDYKQFRVKVTIGTETIVEKIHALSPAEAAIAILQKHKEVQGEIRITVKPV